MKNIKANFGTSLALLLILRTGISVMTNLFIYNKNNIELQMIKNYFVIGISLGITVLFIKKRQDITFVLSKLKPNIIGIKIVVLSILLGIGFSLFNR